MTVPMLRTAATSTVLALALLVPGSAVQAGSSDDDSGHGRGHRTQARIELPTGWQPEGITTDGKRLYAGSLADGRLLRADPRSGRTKVLPKSRTMSPAVGIDHDRRRDVLWVAGGPSGEIRAHHARSGKLLGTWTMPPANRFVNDLVVTRDAVYATDSFNPELAVVPLDGKKLPASGETDVLPVTGDFAQVGGFNLNGIVETRRHHLVAVQTATGQLFRIDPGTGDATLVDLHGYSVANGDGLELDHDLLYVVRNFDNLVVAIELEDDATSGEVEEEITAADLDVPTTVALVRHHLFAVNARFGSVTDPTTADYWITRLPEAD